MKIFKFVILGLLIIAIFAGSVFLLSTSSNVNNNTTNSSNQGNLPNDNNSNVEDVLPNEPNQNLPVDSSFVTELPTGFEKQKSLIS